MELYRDSTKDLRALADYNCFFKKILAWQEDCFRRSFCPFSVSCISTVSGIFPKYRYMQSNTQWHPTMGT